MLKAEGDHREREVLFGRICFLEAARREFFFWGGRLGCFRGRERCFSEGRGRLVGEGGILSVFLGLMEKARGLQRAGQIFSGMAIYGFSCIFSHRFAFFLFIFYDFISICWVAVF